MFLQGTTPDTSGYMIAGYTITFVVMILYIVSMYLRSRNLNQDLAALKELEMSMTEPEANTKKAVKTVTKKPKKK